MISVVGVSLTSLTPRDTDQLHACQAFSKSVWWESVVTPLTPTTLINSTPVIPSVNHFPHLTSLTPTTLIIEGNQTPVIFFQSNQLSLISHY